MGTLGNLKRLDPRHVWAHEATEFTPWLADQIEMLGDAIGLELELHDYLWPVCCGSSAPKSHHFGL